MREFGLKVCLFLFLVAAFSGRTNDLGAITCAVTGTILLWPIYRKFLPLRPARRKARAEAEEETASVSGD
jgi:hypothetical protein